MLSVYTHVIAFKNTLRNLLSVLIDYLIDSYVKGGIER